MHAESNGNIQVHERRTKELFNLPLLQHVVLKARHLSGSAFWWDTSRLGIGCEDKPSEFSC